MAKSKEIPIELRINREIIEGNFVMSLWKNPLELYGDYNVNPSSDLITDDGIFYYTLGNQMSKKGIKSFDAVAIATYLKDYPDLELKYKSKGEFKPIKDIMDIIDDKNIDSYYNELNKNNIMLTLYNKGFSIIDDLPILKNFTTADDVYNFYDGKLSTISLNTAHELNLESLDISDEEWESILNGENMGLNYGKHSPILNYLTNGLPLGDLTMFSSFTNGGKSSYIMSNIIIPLAEQKIKTCIIANESNSITYKLLLLTYAITEDLHYYKLTRKKIKNGEYTEEERKIIEQAKVIIKEKYAPYIIFQRVFDYDMKKVKKTIKKLSKQGVSCLAYDTMKYSGEGESTWMSLLQDSKDLFQICSQNNVAGLVTFQLALSMKNKVRWLDESVLANGKQVAEVFSEMTAFRDIWDDEYTGCSNDIHAYKFKKDENGKFTNIREVIEIKPDDGKKYKIFFLHKTRNNDNGICILYEFQGVFNKWKEIGYCTPGQKNRI